MIQYTSLINQIQLCPVGTHAVGVGSSSLEGSSDVNGAVEYVASHSISKARLFSCSTTVPSFGLTLKLIGPRT